MEREKDSTLLEYIPSSIAPLCLLSIPPPSWTTLWYSDIITWFICRFAFCIILTLYTQHMVPLNEKMSVHQKLNGWIHLKLTNYTLPILLVASSCIHCSLLSLFPPTWSSFTLSEYQNAEVLSLLESDTKLNAIFIPSWCRLWIPLLFHLWLQTESGISHDKWWCLYSFRPYQLTLQRCNLNRNWCTRLKKNWNTAIDGLVSGPALFW